jgi:hypothetical protein
MADPVPEGYIEKIAPDGQRHWFKADTPEEEIQAVIEQDKPSSTLGGYAKAAGTGLARGVTGILGTLGDTRDLYNALLEKAGAELTPAEKAPSRLTPTSQDVEGAVEGVTGEFYEPQTSGEKFVSTIGEFVPGLFGGGAGLARKAITQVAAPAVASEAAGQATEGTAAEPWARLIGALLGSGASSTGGTALPPKAPAANKLAERALEADALTPEGAVKQLQEMGPEAMAADLGPNLTQQAAGIASLPGAGQQIVRGALAKRTAGAGGRATDLINSTLGPQRNIVELGKDIINRRSAESSPIWEAAMAQPVNPSDWMMNAIKDPVMQKGLAEGLRLQRIESLAKGEKFDPTDYAVTGFNEAGDPIIGNVPNMRTMHIIKMGLDGIINDSKNVVTGRLNQEGNAVTGLKRRLVQELDAANPLYAEARRAWEGPTKVHEALNEGQEVFRRSVSPDELKAQLADMNASEREAFQAGARAQVAELMGTARNDAATAWRELVEKGWNREKLALLVGDAPAKELVKRLGGEKAMQNTAARVTGNSETAARAAAQAELGDPQFSARGSITGGALSGATTGAVAGGALGIPFGAAAGAATVAGTKGLEKVVEMFGGASQRTKREALAKILSATGPERDVIIGNLGKRPPRDWSNVPADMRRQAILQALMLPREVQQE